jgi:hypothetical protein
MTNKQQIDLGALQEVFVAARKQHDRDVKDLARAQEAVDRSAVALERAAEALKSATRTVLVAS